MKILFALAFVAVTFTTFSQKKVLDPSVYNDWKSISQTKLSEDGSFAAYQIKPHRGDGYVYWVNTETKKKDSVFRGFNPKFIGNRLTFLLTPGFDTLRTLELEKVKKDNWVKDTLVILDLSSNEMVKIADFKKRTQSKEGNWFAYTVHSNGAEPEKKKCKLFGRKKNKDVKVSSEGKALTVNNFETSKSYTFLNVTTFSFNENGTKMFIVFHENIDDKDNYTPAILNLENGELNKAETSFNAISSHSISKNNSQISFLASNDTVENNKLYDLYIWSTASDNYTLLADTNAMRSFDQKTVSSFKSPYFSEDGESLYFGIKERPEQEPEDTLIASEKVALDLWHYEDDRLQPQQLLDKRADNRKTDLMIYHLKKDKFIQLSNDTLDVYIDTERKEKYALAVSNQRYAGTYNWVYPWPNDFYRIDLNSGETKLIKENQGYFLSLSPTAKYATYWDEEKEEYYIIDVATGKENCMTCSQDLNWSGDVNGMPHNPSSRGSFGYTNNEKEFILYSEFDIHLFDIETNTIKSLTDLNGKQENTEFRLGKWSYDSTYVNLENIYVKGYNKTTKAETVYSVTSHANHYDLNELYGTDHKILGITKAKKSDEVIFREMSAIDYPDAHLTTTSFNTVDQISVTNPQQAEYNWTTVESIYWTSYDSIPLEGLLYKPENYDPSKSYPLMVYFYELYSDRYHSHNAPRPTASIIFPTEYASAGYFVFIPDVRYKEGHPAQSAYDCILSGTDRVLEKYPAVDSTRMALQGQSWGGYQTAQLVTMTNRYKAAMAGAPVSNMFSAYGGIRWGSGLNRQFQYERTQSRIGKTIWEAPELYVENSPLFGVPKIETPLLIMHNDGDGAVPWYQGIEMFTAMKRLGKPVWMLNYNGDQHNLMRNANRMDLSIRMRQFFDYYLLDAPQPLWLKNGIPATVKGKEYRLGY